MSWECETCTRSFWSIKARDQHMNALDHWAPRYECETCDREFTSMHASTQHMNALGHWAQQYECETCYLQFMSESACNNHMSANGHYKLYCQPCGRFFQNENNLQMHLNSRVHRGAEVPCPFCKACYTTASGLSHHLESGSCPNAPSLNRATIHKMIRSRDPHGFITQKQIGWHGDSETEMYATGESWNGDFYECYLCHRGFNTLRSLNQHLASPAHKQRIYHCPNRNCGKEFVSLAALFSHLESEGCSYMRFEQVQKNVQTIVNSRRMIVF